MSITTLQPVPATAPAGAPDDFAIETCGLTKRYGDRLAVDDLDLRVRRGEVYGLLGINGAGKTTTMRMLLGLVEPTAGTASVLRMAPGTRAAAKRIGALIETPGIYPHLSARDNLRVVAGYGDAPESRIQPVLERVGLADRADERSTRYSLGMKQRLGVAIALLKDPELLILDEPGNGLDPIGTAEMRTLIRDLAAEGRTVLLSSHMMAEVELLSDRVGIVSGGRLVAEGPVEQLRGQQSLRVRVGDAAAARTALAGYDVYDAGAGELTVATSVDDAPAVTRALVQAGVDVQELRQHAASLEDVFFALTATTAQEV